MILVTCVVHGLHRSMADIEVNGDKTELNDETKGESDSKIPEDTDCAIEEESEKSEEISNLEKLIIRQVEYYFGDINLPRDKFLLEQIKLDDGWIPLEVMLKFQRLANLTKDVDVIVAALRKAKSGLLQVSEDQKKLRRNPERVLPQQNEERRKKLMEQTVYCKGFPLDSSLDNLLDYFQKFGSIESVFMRHYLDKKKKTHQFKGSVFVLFSSKELAEAFLKLEEVKYNDNVLLRMWQSDYIEKKKLERKPARAQGKAEKNETPEQNNGNKLPRGSILHLKGDFGDLSRDNLKATLEEKEAKVAYITWNKGDEEAWVRLHEENSAKLLLEKLEDNKLVVKDSSLEVRILEGEEEETFLNEAMADMTKRRNSNKQNFRGKRGGRGGGRGGRGHFQNRKRKADGAGDGPLAKQAVKN